MLNTKPMLLSRPERKRMKVFVLIIALLATSAICAQPAGHLSEHDSALEDVDRKMVELLLLRDDQIEGYLKVIRVQRQALIALSDTQWEEKLELYKGTIDMLKPVLDTIQLAQFSAYLGCLIGESEDDMYVSNENEHTWPDASVQKALAFH